VYQESKTKLCDGCYLLQIHMANAVAPLKSLHADSQSLVTFISRTHRPFCVYWLDYHGRHVKYCQLTYAQQFNIRTFETHPWIFRDSETGDKLVTADGSEVYMPRRWEGGHAERVIIGIPGWFSIVTYCIWHHIKFST